MGAEYSGEETAIRMERSRVVENRADIVISIDERLCYGCGDCIQRCPEGVLGFKDDTNSKGVFPASVVRAHLCTACRICQGSCRYHLISIQVVG